MGPRRHRGPRSFDPVRVGRLETDAWAAYYRREWFRALRAFVGLVAEGFGMGPRHTLVGAWHVLRANQAWAPYPDNDTDLARERMRRFYALVAAQGGLRLDPTEAARLEVRWWHLHRARQHDPSVAPDELAASLVDLYSYVYDVPPDTVAQAAAHRVEAMDLSDRWVDAGCHRDDPLLAAERRAMVASHSALFEAVTGPHPH